MNTNKQKLSDFMNQVWNQGDFTNLEEMVSESYKVGEDRNDPWSNQSIDHETFKKRVMYSRNAFPDLVFDVHEMVGESDCVAIRWTMSGTHLADLPQLKASGKKFAIEGMTFYYFEHDKITGHEQSFDQLGFLMQIGTFGMR